MTHRFGDLYALPGLTNFLGCVQVDLDPVGIRSFNLPPLATSDVPTATCFLDGRLFHAWGAPVTFRWRPDRIVREAEANGLLVRTTTVLAWQRTAVLVRIEVENRSGEHRAVPLRLALRHSLTCAREPWGTPLPPRGTDHTVEGDAARDALRATDPASGAVQLQGLVGDGPITLGDDMLDAVFDLAPGATGRCTYVHALGETRGAAEAAYDAVARDPDAAVAEAEREWNAELEAVFTPGNTRYGGHLPTLHTSDAAVQRLYWTGALGVVYFKRDTPQAVHGRAYDTLMPRYWQSVTFLWDYFLSSTVHALLDPGVMRGYLDRWLHLDIHRHFGTEYLTGAGVGNWYAVNDFALVTMASRYVRWTGDTAWLTSQVEGRDERVIDAVRRSALNWKGFRGDSGLADYGGLDNLLECVHSYLHEVAGFNAANVYNLRETARLLDHIGEADDGGLAADATQLLQDLHPLYVDGGGHWQTRFPDGSTRPVRHVLDLLTVLNTIPDDLTQQQRSEMVRFFQRELQTPTWMHALSPADPDAARDVRPDHQWNGAYPAWPPETLRGLYRLGEADLAHAWMQGLAESANQGPFGQAHFTETAWATTDGAATKVPPDEPYINDWSCSSNGSWVSAIVEGLFGVRAGLDGTLEARPQFGPFDAGAELHNLDCQGERYHVTREGARSA